MAVRKVTVEKMETVYDGPTADTARNEWSEESQIRGGEKVVAGFLRALADEIDPPEKQYRN